MYKTWKEIVDNKEKLIGCIVVEERAEKDLPTIIEDIQLDDNSITIIGKHWSMMTGIKYGKIFSDTNYIKITSSAIKDVAWVLYKDGKYPNSVKNLDKLYEEETLDDNEVI